MLTLERQNQIIEILKQKSPTSVRELSKKLYVSEATIRRDLIVMEEQLLIKRMHGGALLSVIEQEETGFSFRMNEKLKEKERIASLAIPLIKNCKSIFMDSSSTTAILAQRADTNYSTIVTTGMETALKLSKKESNNVILIGGSVTYGTNSVSGPMTINQLSNFNFDVAILSCAGVDNEFFATDKTLEQSAIKKQVLNHSTLKILLIDSSKFDVTNLARICSLKDFNYVITDKKPNQNILDFANENKIKILF